ncbi:hypothetical protein MAR_010207 [Mya arenaria]|uniref:Uncharacterized protein n=1 Tax=Mya arenaria TaxID=6604 RepID=A0ABY7E5G5_MYAAR|nr:hypothetical protein MAR_010207 [Mya arenaria]
MSRNHIWISCLADDICGGSRGRTIVLRIAEDDSLVSCGDIGLTVLTVSSLRTCFNGIQCIGRFYNNTVRNNCS